MCVCENVRELISVFLESTYVVCDGDARLPDLISPIDIYDAVKYEFLHRCLAEFIIEMSIVLTSVSGQIFPPPVG